MIVKNFERGVAARYVQATLDTKIAKRGSAKPIDPQKPIDEIMNEILTDEGRQLIPFLQALAPIKNIYLIGEETVSVEINDLGMEKMVKDYISDVAATIDAVTKGATA